MLLLMGLVCHTKQLPFLLMCGKIYLVIEMLINAVVKNEAIRNEQMIAEYEKRIAKLPKGSLICRKQEYYYLRQHRINAKNRIIQWVPNKNCE